MNSNNLHMASHQWATRPNDQRFLTLQDLKASVDQRKQESWTATPRVKNLRALPTDDGGLVINTYDTTSGQDAMLHPTNWSFNQLSQYAKAPAGYLRQLPPELAAINLQWGLENNPIREDTLMLAQSNGDHKLRALTSVSYGRIWDGQVVDAVIKANWNGDWQVPASSYTTTNPLRATTLYASDRDVFLFLVDPNHPIEVGNETLFRGFFVWNSEVGSCTFGLTTFLYRYVCDNRIVWGATDVKELRIRHTGGAPERFAYEGAKYLQRYANESTDEIIDGIVAAQETEIPLNRAKHDDVSDWLRDRGFTKEQAAASVQTAKAEEGEARTIWQIVNGITAYARSISHTDQRVALETKAGQLMKFATG